MVAYRLRVSIPLWFDSNAAAAAESAVSWDSFNSTLVRFKQPHPGSADRLGHRFNSTLVRFKLHLKKQSQARSPCFNSTLVRFKRGSKECGRAVHKWFQFHSGSIQTLRLCL